MPGPLPFIPWYINNVIAWGPPLPNQLHLRCIGAISFSQTRPGTRDHKVANNKVFQDNNMINHSISDI